MGLRDERGMMAIGVALMLIVVLSLFGGALWQFSMAELKRVERTEQDVQALFLARAGAEMVRGIWLDPEQSRPELPIVMDPIYYSFEGSFSLTEPEDCLGVIQVTVKKEDYAYDGELTEVTVIESVATVGSTKRTARLMTYPHRYGHDLAWYSDNDGKIYAPATPPNSAPHELVLMRTSPPEKGIYIERDSVVGSSYSRRSIPFEAGHLIFESPLNLPRNESNFKQGPNGKVDVVLTAEVIFMHGVELAYLPDTLTNPMKSYSIRFQLPKGKGRSGTEIQESIAAGAVIPSALYGEVYFDAGTVAFKEFEWRAIFGIGSVRHRATYSLGLSNKAYYFKEGLCLDAEDIYEHIENRESIASFFATLANDGMLVPISDDAQLSREELQDIQPFFWNQ
jgi:hypothetical protein